MGISDGDGSVMGSANESVLEGDQEHGRISDEDGKTADGKTAAEEKANGVRGVEESREEAAGDQDDAAETEADEDRTQGYS